MICQFCKESYERKRYDFSSISCQKLECREARRRRNNRAGSLRQHHERRKWLDDIKLESGCIDCGYKGHPAALTFDHRDPQEKLFRLSTSLTRSKASIEAEIAKCDVRCANCHAIRTVEEGHHTITKTGDRKVKRTIVEGGNIKLTEFVTD